MCKIIYFIVRFCIIKSLLCRSKKIPPCKFIIFSDATEKSIDNIFFLYYNLWYNIQFFVQNFKEIYYGNKK